MFIELKQSSLCAFGYLLVLQYLRMWIIILTSIFVVFVYFAVIKPHKYWKEKGVPHLKPWPFFGNMASIVFQRSAIGDLVNDMYKSFPNERYFGLYQFYKPTLLIRDPDLIRDITVNEFDTFPDHQTFTSHLDPLWSRNLLALNSIDGWHDMRTTLSPLFTKNNLIMMYNFMEKCAEEFTSHFEKGEDTIIIELKDAFTRFTNDVIASTAFGINCNSLKDKDNVFYAMGKDATNFSGFRALKCLGYTICPSLMKLFRVKLFSQEVTGYFRKLIKETLKTREEKQIFRPDMIHLLMEAKRKASECDNHMKYVNSDFPLVQELRIDDREENRKCELNEDDITAQVLIFLLEGFETASTLMCYAAYELALKPEVQDKLREEIRYTVEACREKINYDTLSHMKYLDNIVSEVLRKWPPVVFTDRKSIKPITIHSKQPGESPLYLEAGTVCWIPIYPLHRDPNHFPDPERFDPDRFNDENRQKIKPFTYIPFGSGPRNCIATQFALLETKVILVELVRKYELVPISRTPIPLKMNRKGFNPISHEGVWIGLRKSQMY